MQFKFKHTKINLKTEPVLNNGVKIIVSNLESVNKVFKATDNSLKKLFNTKKEGNVIIVNDHTLILNLGEKKTYNLEALLQGGANLAKFIYEYKLTKINLEVDVSFAKLIKLEYKLSLEKFLIELISNLYYFDEFKTTKHELFLEEINILTNEDLKSNFANVIASLNGFFNVLDLANLPSNIANPTYLADFAKNLVKNQTKAEAKILSAKEMKKLGMHALLGVAQGSLAEPKFIQLEYFGAKKTEQPIVLIGKGITFDSGGISLKPSPNMNEMKYDMCGAATVLGLFQAVSELKLKLNLIVLVPSCENMPSGSAQKPGDIVTTMSGKTVEILNTDAEGRLILCDALHYAKQFNPQLVIDVATLTGACVIALGDVASGLYVNNEELYQKFLKAEEDTNDKVWRMPLFKEYKRPLKGKASDLLNIGGWGGKGGSATAASFLEEFTDYSWAHLDIAGTSHNESGATGRPFKLLLELMKLLKA